MERRNLMSPESAQASDIFDKFCSANTLKAILSHYRQLCDLLRLQATHFPDFYPRLRSKLCSWRAQGLWSKFEKRASHKSYSRGKSCAGCRVLIIGAGPCGLRTAIEAQLLGAKVVLIEKRDRFSRNNVLHLWPFVITDLKALGAKKFYGKFCAGSIDHISIRQLQCILLKVALLLGVEIHEGVGFEGLHDPTENEGWRAVTSPADHPVSQYHFDCLIGADGRRNTLDGFKRKALRAKLAIAITANFINKRTEAEARVKEISGVSYIFNQKFFQDLNEATGIDLENIVYYKDETHYFVMTAKKHSLLQKGVLLHDYADTAKLLSHENISTEALMIYALESAIFSTENQLPNLEYAVNHYGQPDVAMFDFTAMYAAENACRVVQRKGHKLMMTLVGDSLLEPFWPTGSGCARGFLSCFDACWMLRSLAAGTKSLLEVIAERESIYRLLAQTTPENLNKEHIGYTIDPQSRYPNLNQRVVMPFQVRNLYDSDETIEEQVDGGGEENLETERTLKKRRRDTVIAVDSLLSWLRGQVKCYGLEISDVSDAYVSGDILLAILHRFRPDLIEFPPTSEENISPIEMAASRNQMAFDVLQKDYGVPPVMNGNESVQCNPSDFLTMVAYLSQLYDIFKGEIPQIKYPRGDGGEDLEDLVVVQHYSNNQVKYVRPPAVIAKHGAVAKVNRRSRVSSSSSREGRWDGETSETSRRHRKRRSDERSRISLEDQEECHQEIERNRAERQKRRIQERMLQTERFIKSMRLLQMNNRADVVRENDSFEDYTMHLYRQLAPKFEERCKDLERKLFFSGREHRTSTGESHTDAEKHNVTGLTKHLEEKLKGSKHVEKKPKDLIRAIGKIEKSDWNVQLIEKKIAESKTHTPGKKERDDKVPKWSREAFDDKREAMKRKMEGGIEKDVATERAQLFEETMKKIGTKLTDGTALEIGQRGCNKVSQMAEKLAHNLVKTNKEIESGVTRPMTSRPVFEFPKKGGSETCHFCIERVYVVERMTAEGKFFHRNCFRCEYCNTSLRLGNYSFDREGRYGDRFYCLPHYNTIRLYGWKKYDQEGVILAPEGKLPETRNLLLPSSQQILSEMDERGTTPERVEFENTVDFASEEELLSEMDEDEWTDRNFGASNADNNTSDEASDLSEDDDATPEGIKEPAPPSEVLREQVTVDTKEGKDTGSSDSDTEIASVEGSYEDVSGDEDEVEDNAEDDDEDEDCDEEEEEEECGGSTTEVETDSEFAEDPPHSVPGKIPTIVVNEPEQFIARMSESTQKSQPKLFLGKGRAAEPVMNKTKLPEEKKYEEVHYVDPVPLRQPVGLGRALPRVYPILKKWEPLAERDRSQDVVGSKMSNELKQKYLHGAGQVVGLGAKRTLDPTAQSHLTSVLDMISEKQKLLQPAAQPSPSMQAFLDGTNKLKNTQIMTDGTNGDAKISPSSYGFPLWPQIRKTQNVSEDNQQRKETINMNRINLEKTIEAKAVRQNEEKVDTEKDILNELSELSTPNDYNVSAVNMNGSNSCLEHWGAGDKTAEITPQSPLLLSSENPLSLSQSKTSSQCTVIDAGSHGILDESSVLLHSDTGDDIYSDTDGTGSETGSAEPVSDLDDMDDMDGENQLVPHEPPRVEIEDEFGVTLSLDVEEPQRPVDVKVIKPKKCNDEEDPSLNSYCGMSWSDSKDSLSGMFLESELSDWSRGPGNDFLKNDTNSGSKQDSKGHGKDKNLQGTSTLPFDLDAASLDFADVDGVSSPDDLILSEGKMLGYSKLLGDEESFPLLELEGTAQEENDGNTSESDRSSTSTLGSLSKNIQPEELINNATDQIIASQKVELVEAINQAVEIPVQFPTKTSGPSTLSGVGGVGNYAILDRVVPFSNARDSLDYRKTKGLPSPTKSKDLFSTYAVPSALSSLKSVLNPLVTSPVGSSLSKPKFSGTAEEEIKSEQVSHEKQNLSANSSSQDQSLNKSSASPNTVRRIDEINKERAFQSDLIRSMVMGRIRRSPEKNRRGSLGSLSPIAGTSSSSTSDSGELPKLAPKQLKGSNNENNDSNRSSQNSILSHNTGTGTDDSLHSSNNAVAVPGEDDYVLSSEEASHSSKYEDNSRSSGKAHYEPVFTSSPRFRNRPKFDGPLSIYQSVTNPPTPVNPTVLLFTPVTPVTPSSGSDSSNTENAKSGLRNSSSPSLYRSMPDLSKLFSGDVEIPEKHHKVNKVSSFATPDVKRWEVYKYASTIDREKARQEARERARLKSDEELGLSPKERHSELKDKLKRKFSCPEEDIFTTPIAVRNLTGYSNSEPNSKSAPLVKGQHPNNEATRSPTRQPVSEVSDNVASSIRHNVDFPMKNNPFLVSQIHDSRGSSGQGGSKDISLIGNSTAEDDMDIHLRITPKDMTPIRKKSPEKARSVGWDVGAEPFPNYFSSSPSAQPTQPNPGRGDHNWFSGMSDSKHSTPVQRARANTVSELHLNQLLGQSIHTSSGNNCVLTNPSTTGIGNQGPEECSSNLGLSNTIIASAGTLLTAYQANKPDTNTNTNTNTNTKPVIKNISKTKALSTDMLLDGSSSLALAPFRGVSVPDVTTTTRDINTAVAASERKQKKSKDRFRRRSLIQTVSDFFTSRAPNALTGSNSTSITENEKSSSTTSTTSSSLAVQTGGGPKEKFSLFKLTPKILQKDKRSPNGKSRESIPLATSPPGQSTAENSTPKPTTIKSPRASFISYLSQPEMIIQKLTSSPIPFKSSRASLSAKRPGKTTGETGQTTTPSQPKETPKLKPNPNAPEARRIREAREIQLQLESIEIEQRRLESRGVTIEKRLRGEESDDENRDEVELMEEWFTLVREKTRLARFERELIVREKELELEHKQEKVEEKLEESLLIDDADKDPEVKAKEIDMWNELKSLESQRESLLTQFHEDMQKYEAEDAELEAKIASSSLSPRESNV